MTTFSGLLISSAQCVVFKPTRLGRAHVASRVEFEEFYLKSSSFSLTISYYFHILFDATTINLHFIR